MGSVSKDIMQILADRIPGTIGNPIRCSLSHPMCDTISYFVEPEDNDYMEAAFFMGNEWVSNPISEFAEYAEAIAGDTRVYRYIPRQLLLDFIDKYQKV